MIVTHLNMNETRGLVREKDPTKCKFCCLCQLDVLIFRMHGCSCISRTWCCLPISWLWKKDDAWGPFFPCLILSCCVPLADFLRVHRRFSWEQSAKVVIANNMGLLPSREGFWVFETIVLHVSIENSSKHVKVWAAHLNRGAAPCVSRGCWIVPKGTQSRGSWALLFGCFNFLAIWMWDFELRNRWWWARQLSKKVDDSRQAWGGV